MLRTKTHSSMKTLFFPACLAVLHAVCAGQGSYRPAPSSAVMETARIIGVEPLLHKVEALRASRESAVMSLEELSLRQQITEAVAAASLDVDSVVDQIDNERAQIVELQSILLARRQRAIGTTNLATLALGTGLGAVGGVLQFSETTKGAGNAIGFVAGGLSTLLSFHSFRQQHSGARPAWILPNMLGPFFDESPDVNAYPADIWTYLTRIQEGSSSAVSRRDQIMTQWRAASRFPALNTPQFKSKISLLVSTDASDKKLSMDLLSERAAMLADVRSEVSAMKLALAEILRQIKASRQPVQ